MASLKTKVDVIWAIVGKDEFGEFVYEAFNSRQEARFARTLIAKNKAFAYRIKKYIQQETK